MGTGGAGTGETAMGSGGAGTGGNPIVGGGTGGTSLGPDGGVAVTIDAPAIPDAPSGMQTMTNMPAEVRSFCGTLCQRTRVCDTSRDEAICLETCANTNASIVPKLRADVLAEAVQCLVAKDCASILMGNVANGCFKQAIAAASPSPGVPSFCTAYFQKADQCLDLFSRPECEAAALPYSDSFINLAGTCLQKSCDDYNTCADLTLNGVVGSTALWPGLPKVKKCVGQVATCASRSSSYAYDYDLQECKRIKDCSGAFSCAGTPTCRYRYEKSSCESDPGCTWNPGPQFFDQCSGTPMKACASFSTEPSCRAARDCAWFLTCSGTARACSVLSPADCLTQPGCRLE
jgi:hypothetical protein